jgi:hypothetical protein
MRLQSFTNSAQGPKDIMELTAAICSIIALDDVGSGVTARPVPSWLNVSC